MDDKIRWVKMPSPGQFRGEGEWKDWDLLYPGCDKEWQNCVDSEYLPTKIQAEKPTN
jgi:hypothetical protein